MLRIHNTIIFTLATLVLWPLESQASTQPAETLTRIRYARLTPSLGSAYFDFAIDKGLFKRYVDSWKIVEA